MGSPLPSAEGLSLGLRPIISQVPVNISYSTQSRIASAEVASSAL